jgi:hypothetical protein
MRRYEKEIFKKTKVGKTEFLEFYDLKKENFDCRY